MTDISKLETLVGLFRSGSINKEEFEMLKAEVLNMDENIIEQKKAESNKEKNTQDNWQMSQPRVEVEEGKLSLKNEQAARKQKWAEEDKAERQKSNKAISKGFTTLAVIVGIVVFIVTFLDNNSKSKNSTTETNNTSTNSSNNESNYVSHNKCSICGRQFTGDGYEEVSDGVWRPSPSSSQSYICSPECGMVHTKKMNSLVERVTNANSQKCTTCGLGHYKDGFCDMCGAASKERVNESSSIAPKCESCGGSGYVDGYDGREICPSCNGSGRQTF